MPVTRIKNNQITDLTVNAASKLQDFSITSTKIANNLTYGSDFTITGNLTVQGNVTAIDTVDLVVEDPLILLAKDQTGTPSLDIGFIGKRGDEDNIAFVWDEGANRFVAAFTTSEVTNTVITINSYASLQVLDLDAANLTITGNTVLGNLSLSGNVLVDMGNSIISNVAEPVANSDVATKAYVDSQSSSGFTIEDDTANTTVVSGGDTLALLGTADEITVLITDVDEVTFGLPANVTIANNLTVTDSANVGSLTSLGNISGDDVSGNTGTFTGNVSADLFLGNIEGDTGTFTGNVAADYFLGNIEGDTGIFTGNVSAANIDATTAVNTNLISGTGLVIVSTGDLDLQPSGNVDVSGAVITNIGGPFQSSDAATKQYVDDAVSTGITIHEPVRLLSFGVNLTGTYAQGGNVFTVTETVAGNTVVFSTAANLQVNDQLWFDNSFNGVVGNLAYFVVSTPNTSAAVLSTVYNGEPVSNIANASGLTESVRVNSGQGATLTATADGAIVIDSVTANVADRVLLESQTANIENGVYVVTDTGNLTAPWILTRSSDMDTYIPDNINGLDAGDYFFVQDGANNAGQSHVMTSPVGPVIIGYDDIVFTQFSASQVYTANVNAGLVLVNNQFNAKVDNDTTAFDFGGNIKVKDGANLVTPNIGNATGESLTLSGNGLLSATTISVTGNVSADLFLGNIEGGTGTFTGNVTVDTILGNIEGDTGTFTGNVAADYFIGNGSQLTGISTSTSQIFNGTSNVDIATANANITMSVDGISNVVVVSVNQVAITGNLSSGNIVITGESDLGNIRIQGNDITNSASNEITINQAGDDIDFIVSGNGIANLLVVDASSDTVLIGTGTPTTNAALKIGTTNSIIIPVGTTGERPDAPETGMVRFNTSLDVLEFYDSDSWTSSGASNVTVIVADSFTGDGSTVQFILNEDSTTAATIVSINGVVQEPTVAYAVSGNVLTFTEAPEATDVIDARIIQTTVATDVLGITNAPANASITGNATQSAFDITGNLIPTANVTYDLGSVNLRWKDIYLANSTIYLGEVEISADGGNLVLPSTVQIGNAVLDASSGNLAFPEEIQAQTLQVSGNITAGNIEATGNISGNFILGNGSQLTGIDATSIQNGTSNVRVASSNGNVVAGIGGTDNIVVISTAGANITGTLGVTGNVTAGNVSGTNITGTIATASQTNITSVGTLDSLTVTGNVSGGNLTTSGAVTGNGSALTSLSASNISSGTLDLARLGTTGNLQLGSLGVGTAASNTVGEIRATNNITAFFSDQRLKTDITSIPDALNKVMQISGVTFRSNDTAAQYGYRDPKLQVGVIAQEIQAVLPEIVVPAPFDIGQNADGTEYSVSGEHYMTVQYDKLVPLLIEAIKDLKAEIDQLKNTKE